MEKSTISTESEGQRRVFEPRDVFSPSHQQEPQDWQNLLDQKNRHLAKVRQALQTLTDSGAERLAERLAVMRELATLLQDSLGDRIAPARRTADLLLRNIDDFSHLTESLFAWAQLEAGAMSARRRHCDAAVLLEQVRGPLECLAREQEVRFVVEPPATGATVYCDPEKARQAITSLAANAIHYACEGGSVRLWARIDSQSAEIVVGVTDDSPAPDPGELAELIERFDHSPATFDEAALGGSRKREPSLATARELIRLNLGELHIESQAEVGNTLMMTLPLAAPAFLFKKYLQALSGDGNLPEHVAILSVEISEQHYDAAPVVDERIQCLLRRGDLACQTMPNRWVVAAACSPQETQNLAERLRLGMHSVLSAQYSVLSCSATVIGVWHAAGQRDELTAAFMAAFVDSAWEGEAAPRLVLLDDDEAAADITSQFARAGYEVTSAEHLDARLLRLAAEHPEAVVLDMRRSQGHVVATVRDLRQHMAAGHRPIIMLASAIRKQQRQLQSDAQATAQWPVR